MTSQNPSRKSGNNALYLSQINEKLMDELRDRIIDILLIKKKYRDKAYTSQQLSEDLNTNMRNVSATINAKFNMNYSALVNKYRVEEAMTLLVDKRNTELSMGAIADMVGFANRQSFYNAFDKINECSPKEYKLRHQNHLKLL